MGAPLGQRLSKAQDCTKSIQDSHCAVGPLDVLDDIEAGVSDELHDMSSVRSRLLSVPNRRPAAYSASGHGGCIGRGTALRCAKDGERSRDGGRVYAEVRTRGRGGRCRCGRGRFARCEGGFVQRIVERADEDCDQVGGKEGRTRSASTERDRGAAARPTHPGSSSSLDDHVPMAPPCELRVVKLEPRVAALLVDFTAHGSAHGDSRAHARLRPFASRPVIGPVADSNGPSAPTRGSPAGRLERVEPRLAQGCVAAAMSTSDEEATSLFRRADKSRLASGRGAGGSALRSPSKRLLPPPPDDSSSDIEFVGTSSAIKRRAAQDGKGKGKATADQASSRKLATTSTTNKVPPTRKTGRSSRRRSSASSLDSSSDDDDPRMPISGQILPSATQIADSGATLRALAREKGWQGQSPPPRSRSRTEESSKPAAKKRRQKSASDDSEEDLSDFGHRGGRNVSTSTEQTTISDQSSSSHTKSRKSVAATAPAAGAKRASKKVAVSTARAKPRQQKRASKVAAAASSSPSPDLELDLDNLPPPPESFWGVDTSLTKAGAATKKHKHGEATKRLQTLSEQRAMLVLPDDDDEDEIAIAESGSSSAGENERFELTAVKSKREKEEALGESLVLLSKLSYESAA